MDYKTIIASIFYWAQTKAEIMIKSPELFGKDEKPDKLVIKNQIGYHFKKVVREVNQELFVSRKIDVSLLFAGIQVLQKTETEVRKLCKNLPSQAPIIAASPVQYKDTRVVHVDQTGQPIKKESFVLIDIPTYSSFKEAKARCNALGLQLPEIYSAGQLNLLSEFLKKNFISQCFAGIEPDLSDSIPRHISTQYPIWKTACTRFRYCDSEVDKDLGWNIDDGHAKFMYKADKSLCASLDIKGNPIENKKYADPRFREQNKILNQLMGRVVCTPRWDGMTDLNLPNDNFKKGGLVMETRFNRDVRRITHLRARRSDTLSDGASMRNVLTLCFGVADQAKESHEDIQLKLNDLLALVDITVHTEMALERRQKRMPLFLAKFIFVTGVKLLWQLFGFVQKVKMNKRLKNIESMLKITNDRSLQNSDAIASMSQLISNNSLAIQQLNIRVDGLQARIDLVETQMNKLQQGITSIGYKFETVTSLITIENLVIRTRRSLDSGYDILKDIIHSTKLKQTSPLVLPLDQIELVQNQISKISTAVLDPDFSKMQSIVVSDPNDPTKLLVVINMAALGRRNLELVKMTPVPYFESSTAYEIILDYHTIVLDQNAHTFSILTEQEEYDCLFNRCYVGSSEQSLFEKSCGIPQFYDRNKDGCTSESVITTGVFLKPMLPDGVLFAFQHPVQSQVFCKDKLMSKSQQLQGTGILQLPNGCVLSIIDKHGRLTKVKGQPQYTMITADDLELMPNGPLSALQAEIDINGTTKKVATVNAFVEERVSSVIKQVETVDSKITEQHNHVWALTGMISLFIMIIFLVFYLMYRFSTRARSKINKIRDNFNDLTQRVFELPGKVVEPEIPNPVPDALVDFDEGGFNDPPPHRRRDIWMSRMQEGRRRAHTIRERLHPYQYPAELPIQPDADPKERTYMSLSELDMDEERYIQRPLSRPTAFRPLMDLGGSPRQYPRITTPMLKEAQEYDNERLRRETEMAEQLSLSLSPKPIRRTEI